MNLIFSYYVIKFLRSIQFCAIFILLNAALGQKQNINVTQVNPSPPTVKPEGLLDFKEASGLSEPLNLSSKLTKSPMTELG